MNSRLPTFSLVLWELTACPACCILCMSPEKYLPGDESGGNIHRSVDVILNAKFPELLPKKRGNGVDNQSCVVYTAEVLRESSQEVASGNT